MPKKIVIFCILFYAVCWNSMSCFVDLKPRLTSYPLLQFWDCSASIHERLGYGPHRNLAEGFAMTEDSWRKCLWRMKAGEGVGWRVLTPSCRSGAHGGEKNEAGWLRSTWAVAWRFGQVDGSPPAHVSCWRSCTSWGCHLHSAMG